MTPQELHNTVMAHALVTRTINGIGHSLWLQAGEFVMTRQGGASNKRHQLCADETGPARLAAHWEGFCSTAAADVVHA